MGNMDESYLGRQMRNTEHSNQTQSKSKESAHRNRQNLDEEKMQSLRLATEKVVDGDHCDSDIKLTRDESLSLAKPMPLQHRYKLVETQVEKLGEELNRKARLAMIHHLQMDDPCISSPFRSFDGHVNRNVARERTLPPSALSQIETQVKELDKEIVKVARRIHERNRELTYTMERIEELEMRAILEEEKDFIKGILSKVPTESDMKSIDDIIELRNERRKSENRIHRLDMKLSALNKAMADTNSSRNGRLQKNQKLLPDTLSHSSFTLVPKKKILPDFTKMPLIERKAFLEKNFESTSIQLTVDSFNGNHEPFNSVSDASEKTAGNNEESTNTNGGE